MMKVNRMSVLAVFLLALGACSGKDTDQPAPGSGDGSAPAAAATATPAATGTVIEVKVISDEKGNRFEPREIAAEPGDILRIVLVSGVHNISFPPDSNAGATGLPAPSDLLQLPGQTHDIPISFAPGKYVFQCDPHAALGMTGTLEVERE